MNKQILIGYTHKGHIHKVILDGVDYPEIKAKYNETNESDEFSKIEIWSRANGLEKSKRLKPKLRKAIEKRSPVIVLKHDELKQKEAVSEAKETDTKVVKEVTDEVEDDLESEISDESDSEDFDDGIGNNEPSTES